MRKPKMPRITEPDANEVHFQADGLSGNATLCGLTDFAYADEDGKPTRKAVTCEACKSIKRWCDAHRKHPVDD